MATDRDEEQSIQRSARGLIDQYGAKALDHADLRLKDVIAQRDAEAIRWWRNVAEMIEKLQPQAKL